MKCAKCGLDLPQGTKQCPKCGSINEFVEQAPPEKKRMSPMMYGIIGFAVVGVLGLIIFLMASGKNVTSAPGGVDRVDRNITTAPPGAPASSGLTSAPPGKPGEPMKTPDGGKKPKPPQEVVDYLNYVKKVEEHRQMLLQDTGEALMLSAAGGTSKGLMDMIDMAMEPDGKKAMDPLADSKAELNRQYKNWAETLKYFDQKPAPAECREFSGAYRAVLFNETKAIGEIAGGFNSVNIMDPGDMSKLLSSLQKMKRDPNLQGNIDKSADAADAKLNAIVANYDMEKPFDVPREKQGGNIMGF